MPLTLRPLAPEEAPLFLKAEVDAFAVHAPCFPGGVVPGMEEEAPGAASLRAAMADPATAVLAICDGGRFVGGAVAKDAGQGVVVIDLFFLVAACHGRGLGKAALDLVEAHFPDARLFRLVTPSQVVRNVTFYVNKCGYRIVKVVNYDRAANAADYVFVKKAGAPHGH